MKVLNTLLGALGFFGFGASAVDHARAQSFSDLEYQECERALKENTIEALEEFLDKYPESTECKVLALNALNAFAAGDNDNHDRGSRTPSGGYGG